jgi:hypothetical protein
MSETEFGGSLFEDELGEFSNALVTEIPCTDLWNAE